MRRFVTFFGVVLLLGAIAGVWVQARAADDEGGAFVPPAEFEANAAKPLPAMPGFIADPQVRPSAATTSPRTSSRRGGGLAGRLQSLRNEQTTESTEETAAPVEDALPEETALPSVLKRPSSSRVANLPKAPEAVTPAAPSAASSPSDAVEDSEPAPGIRTAPSRSRMRGGVATQPEPEAAPSASNVKRGGDRAQTLASGASASLAVETTGPKAMTLGKPATYTVLLANQGVTEATDVFLAIDLPANVELADVNGTAGDANMDNASQGQRLVWKLDRIAGRGQEKLTLEVVPQTADPIALNVEWTQAPPRVSAQVEVLEPKLAMELKGPKDVLYGQTAVYQIIVSNPGTGDVEGVVVDLISDDADPSDAKPLGTIAAGQQKVIEVSMTASQAGPMAMHFAAKSGALVAEAREEVMVRRANLELNVAGPQLVFAGADATYKVVVTNTGDAPAEDVHLGTLLPEGSEYLGGLSGVQPKSSQLVWSAGNLAPGKSAEFEFSVLMNTAGTFDIEVQTKADDLTDVAMPSTKVEAVADLKLTVNDPQGPKPVGEEVTYEVTLTNRGTKAARKVAVVVNFSEGIEPISVAGGTAEVGGGQATFAPIISIEPGASHQLKVTAKADRAGSHVFRAEVRCSDPETRLASEQTTRFFGSGGTTAKTEAAAAAPAAGQFVPSTSAKPMLTPRR